MKGKKDETEGKWVLETGLLGNRIKELRRARQLTQSEFAQVLYVSFQAVSNWERGIAPPDLENLIRIAAYFGVTVDELLCTEREPLFLGVDGGGTKTEFVVVDPNGRVVMHLKREGCNPNDVGFEKAFDVICEGIREVQVKFPQLSGVFCGIAGVTVGDHQKRMQEKLRKHYPTLGIEVKTDSANLFAMDDGAEMAVISGTGSVVFVKKGDAFKRLGGWGYLFDSAGSAYDIGRDAVREALRREDLGLPASCLSRLLHRELGCERVFDAVNRLHSGGKPYIASLARCVFEALRSGDADAEEIVERSAKRIAELLESGVTLYGARRRAVAGGGLFEHHADVFLPAIGRYTDTEIMVCTLPPVFGACRQSLKNAGIAIAEDFEYNFKTSCGD